MSQVILNILCEGQTEDRFAQNVLKPSLKNLDIVVKTQLLVTNRKKNIRGGMISYEQAKTDLSLWIKQHSSKSHETHYFTTMFDFYALPNDFPGYEDANQTSDCYASVLKLEKEFSKDIHFARFIPYIQLHEFEALVFCGLEHLLVDYPDMTKEIRQLGKVLEKYGGNPEKINKNPETAPSKQIIKTFELKHHYDKPKLGEFVTRKVGITGLKEKCPHFKEWIEKLEKITEKSL
ncbi:MAG: DUF4276 family protein [Tannerella sp.]|jgi:hypothetical protein|nr:DUF4276 family protein [Tannerella sp.]